MIDYDDPEFADENPMLDPKLKEAGEKDTVVSDDTADPPEIADTDEEEPASDKKPGVPS